MKMHRYGRFAVGFVAMAFVVVAGVLPSDAQARGGGGGFHGGGRGFQGGGRGFHGGGFHGQAFHSRSFHHGGFHHGGFHHGGFHHRGSRVFFGVGIGVPWYYGYPYYGYPYYGYGYPYAYGYPYGYPYSVYSPPVVVESAPPVYIQRDVQPQQYWYYCRESQSYYPSVSECPGGWIQVAPQSQ